MDKKEDSEKEPVEEPENACAVVAVPTQDPGWLSITGAFKGSLQRLSLGELMHDNEFSLYDAMSAIEMMDPKVDSGLSCNRKTPPKAFEQAVQAGTIKLDKFSASELIAIMDTTLSCIVSWLEGHSLAQTVFTNLYLHKPYYIRDKTLRVFSVAIYKLLEIIKDFIEKAQVYEDEDFQPMHYGYQLNPKISDQRIIAMLRETEELHKRDNERTPGAAAIDKHLEMIAVYSRIKFVRIFYLLLITLYERKENQTQTPTECQRLLAIALDILLIMKKTVHIGTAPAGQWYENVMGFEPLINQKLLPPTFPRYTRVKSRNEAFAYYENILERLKTISKIYSIIPVHQALDFLVEFSKSEPCLLSRSILQSLYVGTYCLNPVASSNNFKELLKDAVKFFISIPPEVTKSISVNQQARIVVDTFLSNCVKPFTFLLQISGYNRARQREMLSQLLKEFVHLQNEAEHVDLFIVDIISKSWDRKNVGCYGTWIVYHTLRLMIMYLISGFELELYAPYEYPYIYWYLHEYLYVWLVSTLSKADTFYIDQELLDLQKIKSRKTKAKLKKRPHPYNREIVLNQALQSLSGGLYKALVAFRLDNKLKMPDSEFDNENIRYDRRFSPFKFMTTPPSIHFDEFKDMIETSSADPTYIQEAYTVACRLFQHARELLEICAPINAEVADLIIVCKANFIALKILAEGHKRDSPNYPTFDFSKSKYFPIIKLP